MHFLPVALSMMASFLSAIFILGKLFNIKTLSVALIFSFKLYLLRNHMS